MENCVICKNNEATQKHHVSYKPSMVIEICTACHVKIHNHGTGPSSFNSEAPEVIPILPYYTKTIVKDKITYIVDKNTNEILTNLICPNKCKYGFQLYTSKALEEHQFFLRCPLCGFDIKVAEFK